MSKSILYAPLEKGEVEDAIILLQEDSDFSVRLVRWRNTVPKRGGRESLCENWSFIHRDQLMPLINQLKFLYLRSQEKVNMPLRPLTSAVSAYNLVARALNASSWPRSDVDRLTVTSYSFSEADLRARPPVKMTTTTTKTGSVGAPTTKPSPTIPFKGPAGGVRRRANPRTQPKTLAIYGGTSVSSNIAATIPVTTGTAMRVQNPPNQAILLASSKSWPNIENATAISSSESDELTTMWPPNPPLIVAESVGSSIDRPYSLPSTTTSGWMADRSFSVPLISTKGAEPITSSNQSPQGDDTISSMDFSSLAEWATQTAMPTTPERSMVAWDPTERSNEMDDLASQFASANQWMVELEPITVEVSSSFEMIEYPNPPAYQTNARLTYSKNGQVQSGVSAHSLLGEHSYSQEDESHRAPKGVKRASP